MIKNTIIAGLILLGFAYCKPKANQEEIQQAKDLEKFDENTAAIAEQFSSMSSSISISELGAQFQSMGAEYNADFLNDPATVSEYSKDEDKAATNLGIYYVDLLYAAAYNKKDKAISLYSSAQTLANEIGLGRYFDQSILNRLEGEMSDETKSMVKKSLEDASKNLNTENRQRVTALVLGGVLIERLHLLSSIIDQSRDLEGISEEQRSLLITPAMKAVMNQKESYDKVVEYINLIKEKDDPQFMPLVYSIQNDFNELAELKGQLDRKEAVDPAVLNDLFAAVKDVRANIVSPPDQEM